MLGESLLQDGQAVLYRTGIKPTLYNHSSIILATDLIHLNPVQQSELDVHYPIVLFNVNLCDYRKPKEPDTDEESKKERKKKIIAELFGSSEEPAKTEEKPAVNTTIPSKSDWLELKTDDITDPPFTSRGHETNVKNFETVAEPKIRDDDLKEKSVHFVDNSNTNRRKSEGKPAELLKMKHRFKSLDLDLLDFDSVSNMEQAAKSETKSSDDANKSVNDTEDGTNTIKSSVGKTSFDEVGE